MGVPIGTARDITLRALDVLVSADRLVAEDTRSLRKLMDIHGIALDGRRIQSLHDHTGARAVEELVRAMSEGQSVAYASEAGMPLIADPGFELVRACQEAGVPVSAAPGPSAVTTALALSGLAPDAFHFAGFLPNARGARKRALEGLAEIPATLVLYESPKRLEACLEDAVAVFGPDRDARVCRELTKKFEEIRTGTLGALLDAQRDTPARGEIVLLIARAEPRAMSAEELEARLKEALSEMTLRDAAAKVAAETGQPKRTIYQLGLSLGR